MKDHEIDLLRIQCQIQALQSLVAAEGEVKPYSAPWLKNVSNIFRGSDGKFNSPDSTEAIDEAIENNLREHRTRPGRTEKILGMEIDLDKVEELKKEWKGSGKTPEIVAAGLSRSGEEAIAEGEEWANKNIPQSLAVPQKDFATKMKETADAVRTSLSDSGLVKTFNGMLSSVSTNLQNVTTVTRDAAIAAIDGTKEALKPKNLGKTLKFIFENTLAAILTTATVVASLAAVTIAMGGASKALHGDEKKGESGKLAWTPWTAYWGYPYYPYPYFTLRATTSPAESSMFKFYKEQIQDAEAAIAGLLEKKQKEEDAEEE